MMAGKVMMAFILATDFDFIAYMSKMVFFGNFFTPMAFLKYNFNDFFFFFFFFFLVLFCMIYCITVTCHTNAAKQQARDSKTT